LFSPADASKFQNPQNTTNPMSSSQFTKMWNDPVVRMSPDQIKSSLGGNLSSLTNFCAVRVSHALLHAGHPIRIPSDYKDKDGNKYIIRVKTMKSFLEGKFGNGQMISKESSKGKYGVVIFEDCGWSDATGHADLISDGQVGHKSFWDQSKRVWFWPM